MCEDLVREDIFSAIFVMFSGISDCLAKTVGLSLEELWLAAQKQVLF